MSIAEQWRRLPEGFRDDALEADRAVLLSAGIDIGSSTMHMTISRLVAERDAGTFSIVHRAALYESPIVLTPYRDHESIDADGVMRRFECHYRTAGVEPVDIDAGVVILTGVALDRPNAEALGHRLSAWGGQFLSVAAGDRLEGLLAAQGSGAVARSAELGCVLNVDVGGGTIKITTCRDGRVEDVQAFDVGSRIVSWDPTSRVVERVEPSGARLADRLGVKLEAGAVLSRDAAGELADGAADALVRLLEGTVTGAVAEAARTAELRALPQPAMICLSGGATEFLRGEGRDFGDLGAPLAAALISRLRRLDVPVCKTASGIRSTAIGAGQFTVQVSGVTIHHAPMVVLPLRNLPVAALAADVVAADDIRPDLVAHHVRERLALLDDPHRKVAALAVRWRGSATVRRIEALAEGLARGGVEDHRPEEPFVIVCHGDVARLLGGAMQERLGLDYPLLVIDGVELADLDFVDVGWPLEGSGAVPVTIKSLAFRTADRHTLR